MNRASNPQKKHWTQRLSADATEANRLKVRCHELTRALELATAALEAALSVAEKGEPVRMPLYSTLYPALVQSKNVLEGGA